jgi:hypothetical protein
MNMLTNIQPNNLTYGRASFENWDNKGPHSLSKEQTLMVINNDASSTKLGLSHKTLYHRLQTFVWPH